MINETEIEVKVSRVKVLGFPDGSHNYGYDIKICSDQIPEERRKHINYFYYELGEPNPHFHRYDEYFYSTAFNETEVGSEERIQLFKQCQNQAFDWGDNVLKSAFPELQNVDKRPIAERLWITLPEDLPNVKKKIKVKVPVIC